MDKGTVKWFNQSKGFGFISPDEGGGDIFFHLTSILPEQSRTITDGQKVEFDAQNGNKGRQAINVKPL